MRTAKVLTNLVCNQGCRHCTSRGPSDEAAFVASAAVRRRIDAAIATGVAEVVLTGGEPTMRRDLAELVRHARRSGADVGVETNATLLDQRRVRALADAGIGFVRVNVVAWGSVADEITRDPGGFERTRAGLGVLASAGVPIEIATAVLQPTLAGIASLPAELAAEIGVAAIRKVVVTVPVESPEPAMLASFEDAARAIARLDDAARRVGIRAAIAPDSGPPPCFFPNQLRIAHLYAMTPGATPRPDFVRIEACATCTASDRCIGVPSAYLARRALPEVRPIGDDRVRRRLSLVSSVDEQIRRELVTRNQGRTLSGESIDERIVRVAFQCNQACSFCFVSTHLPAARDEAVRSAIEEAAAEGARIVLSGGEPTLSPGLVEWVALAKRLGRRGVELQTNATLLDDPARVDALARAGLDDAFVSLHGATAEVSDAVTGAPGTFARTLLGVDNLVAAKIRVVLNFVICRANAAELVDVVRLIASRWPSASLNVSFVAPSTDVVPRTPELVPRYSEVLPHLDAALAEAERLGVVVCGFESMCGIPLCLVPRGGAFAKLAPIAEEGGDGEFVKTDTCRRCALASRCHGLRRGYADIHGTSELVAVDIRQPAADA